MSVASLREYGDVAVYIRRMFITDRERDLLPAWARFVRGVIDCPRLQPTASREAVHQDGDFRLVQRALAEQLSAAIIDVAEHHPDTWRAIVVGHADIITGWAATDDEFFERVADLVPFQTTRGYLRLPEYLSLTGGKLCYVTRELGTPQEQLLADSRDLPVLNAHWFAVRPFLEKYAERHPEIELIRLDRELERLLEPVSDEPFELLLRRFWQLGVRVRVATFQPAVPALLMYPKDAEFLVEAQEAVTAGELPEPFSDLIGEYLSERLQASDGLDGILYLNASSPVVLRLAALSGPGENIDIVVGLIYQIARLFAARMLDARDAAEAFEEISQAMEALLS
jgi:molecular chaperone HtpG